ncbi:hypothetical protein GM418_29915 [Maribellus comscasis]|uniref:beta-galactosidase n=1 Tax=Maribellus comscasis TaxID=2681766 RepID=A0A6I6K239_9BACT|nr:sugar-binding domain-containing protein [Maribellus comscasis]QGY47729.1 hypothetical protein GM418_29915 [Maribellus comscasis]
MSYRKFKSHKIKIVILNLLLIQIKIIGAQPNDWQDEQIIGIRNEKTHCIYVQCSNIEQAIRDYLEEFIFYESLNGSWKFNWVKSPDLRPENFFENGFDVSYWDDIGVSSNWQLKMDGMSIYTNVTYPFTKDTPHIKGKVLDHYAKNDLPNIVLIYLNDIGNGDLTNIGAIDYNTQNIDKINGVNLLPLSKGNFEANTRQTFYYYYRQSSLETIKVGFWKLVFPHSGRTYEGFQIGKDEIPGRVNGNYQFKGG